MAEEKFHTIKAAARRVGLSQHVIRVWEKRYRAVQPSRTDTNRRLYGEEEIKRLQLLSRLTHHGHSIGQIAQLPTKRLEELSQQNGNGVANGPPQSLSMHGQTAIPEMIVAQAMGYIETFDSVRFDDLLNRAAVDLGHTKLLNEVVAPLTEQIGAAWSEGKLRIAHEHMASAVLRTFLGQTSRPYALSESAPCIVVATPPGQLHELGAVLAAAVARSQGWRVVYLGCGLPVEEITVAAIHNHANVVALSLVYPQDDKQVEFDLRRIRKLLPATTAIIAGGRATSEYQEVLSELSVMVVDNMGEFKEQLDRCRTTKSNGFDS